jgi:excinuclease ABC subunit A
MQNVNLEKTKNQKAEPAFLGVQVIGAREHNLQNVSVKIPRDKLTVFTGLSGSGKSTLAFDIIYAEGQRRYVESLSAYARQFLEQLKKPDVDSIQGLSPAIAIDQKSIATNPRSTVGTVTEVFDFLRLLYARVGIPRCPTHNVPVKSQTPQQIVDEIMKLKEGTLFSVLAPVAREKKGEFGAEFQKWFKRGFVRAKIDGQWIELEKAKKLEKHKRHNIDLVIDRLSLSEKFKTRLAEAVNLALTMSNGTVVIETTEKKQHLYSIKSACPECGYSFAELDPKMFSFNNPRGACEMCNGLGYLDLPEDLPNDDDDQVELEFDERKLNECPSCEGKRLKKDSLQVFVGEYSIADISSMSILQAQKFFKDFKFEDNQQKVSSKITQQILNRLNYMVKVGTSYLSLDRPTRTLSGGEAQRIRLATQVGSALVGVLYVLDEPSIGLHPRDHHRLLEMILELKDRGNTIIIVEHDEETIRAADHLIDLGPGAGKLGGQLMAEGSPAQIIKEDKSLTSGYLSGRLKVSVPKVRRKSNGHSITLTGATGNNLHDANLELPLGTLIGVTGVSGSGKSTLIIDTLYKELANRMNKATWVPAPFKKLEGQEHIDKIIEIDQRPIGRTPRSTPATYVGLFPMIRDLYSQIPEAKVRGFKPGHFSFNVKGGRCEACQGHGQLRVAMNFMSDVFVMCDTCQGKRYSPEILAIRFKGKNIHDVLSMSVSEAAEFFEAHTLIHRKLLTLKKVGMEYISLGQSSTTLSGGEAQRIKLSRELSKRGTGKTLYILDEPTTGLHFEDVRKLIELLHELVSQGNTVLVIEHNMDVIKNCDHLIDLGPDGGIDGGHVVYSGSPEGLVKLSDNHTAICLKPYL